MGWLSAVPDVRDMLLLCHGFAQFGVVATRVTQGSTEPSSPSI